MFDALLALTILAASTPKVVYKPDPAGSADVATVNLETPRRSPCFGVMRASVLLSSRKADRNRAYVMSVTVADFSSPGGAITAATLGGTPLRLVNVRNGDVACTDYQCPTGSAAVFEISAEQRQSMAAAGALPLQVSTSVGANCKLDMSVDKAAIDSLDAWADKLPKAG